MSSSPDAASLPPGLVLPVRCGPGGPSRKAARGPHWRRTSHGFYVPASVTDDDVRQRIVEASVLVPPGGAITGWAALIHYFLIGIFLINTLNELNFYDFLNLLKIKRFCYFDYLLFFL